MQRNLRVLYGGTFDPIHNGHLRVAEHAHAALQAPVALMPAGDPPHKGESLALADQRATMCGLAARDVPGLEVELREVRAAGPSWTVQTLRALRAEIGDAPLAILIGADSLFNLQHWREWRVLPELAHFVIAGRPGFDLQQPLDPEVAVEFAARWTTQAADLKVLPAGRAYLLHQPETPESATELRRRITAGEPWVQWVPEAVARYILQHHLYGARPPNTATTGARH